jgi:flagellar biosynthesis protein FlhF
MVEVTVALEEENERTPIPVKSISTPEKNAQAKEESKQALQVEAEEKAAAPIPLTALEQLARVQEQQIKEQREREAAAKAPGTNVTNAAALEEKLDNLENLLKQKIEGSEQAKENKADVPEEDKEQMRFIKLLYNTMIDNEVHEKYANQIIEEVEKGASQNMAFDYFLSNVYQKMILKFGKPKKIESSEKGPKVIFFVGPTGVGKTTTIAKIASKFSVEAGKKVALLTADTYRIAAAEQLRTYANILEGKLFAGESANPTGTATEITYDNDDVDVDVENLYVAISAENVPAGIEILEVTYALVRNDGTIYSPSAVVSGVNFASSFALIDIPAGDYTLKAEAKLSTGYIVTTQIQLAIK